MPEVSIVIPSYNSEKFIATTLDSVLGQTFKDIEVIVVDDGSTDTSPEIVRTYGAPIRLVPQKNSGVSAARNRGISEAKGKFIGFIDSDDYWFREKLASQIGVFRTHPEVGVVYSSFHRWESDDQDCFPQPESFHFEGALDEIDLEYSGWVYHLFLLDCWMLTSTSIFRKEVFEKCGNFDSSLPCGEDWDLWLRIAREYPMIKLKTATTLYRQHKQQTTQVVRDIDYRSRLLTQTAEKWGLCSQDGRCIDRHRYLKQLATYHASFARSHLQNGKFSIAVNTYLNAWRCNPLNLKYLAYIPFALLGWRPK
jgi:glycosyltransferase involved in cell wall biosynthesis